MKKNKQDLVERHIYLEDWLKDNYPDNITDNEILSYFMNNFTNKHDILYLIEAYFLPKEDIEEYKENKFIGDIDVYRDLSIKYSVPVDCIIKRMNDIKLMNAESIGIYSTEIDNIKKLDEEFDCFDGNNIFKYIEIELLVEKLSISGLSKNEILKEEIKDLSPDSFFLETDAPYLTPEPYRGKPNEPKYMIYTLRALSEALNINEEELSNILENNFHELFDNNN